MPSSLQCSSAACLLWVVCSAVACYADGATGEVQPHTDDVDYAWRLPDWFQAPRVPPDNPMSEAKVQLGRHLFYDLRLSGNGTQACASCHEQARAFTDGRARAVGSTGQVHRRSAMSLVNVAYATSLTWADPHLWRIEEQLLIPLFGTHPVELGMHGRDTELLDRLRQDAWYPKLFAEAFPAQTDPVSVASTVHALGAFVRTLVSGSSAFDRYLNGDADALSEAAERGLELFYSPRTQCFRCHGGFNLSDAVYHPDRADEPKPFHNTGLYDVDGRGSYPEDDPGLYALTGRPEDMGRFKAPTLRNVAVTAPYMHDGSVATLEDVIAHYAAGGRTLDAGTHAGSGRNNPYKSELITGFELTPAEHDDLIAFLHSLTDHGLLTDSRYASPWE